MLKGKSARPQRLNRMQRRERIVDAALAVFSHHGYRGATTRQLSRAAGITEVTLFRHFPTKERLFGAVLEKYSILPVLRAALSRLPEQADARTTLRRIGRQFLQILTERRDMIRLILSEAAVNPRLAAVLFRQGPGKFLGDAAKILSVFRTRGEIRRVNLAIASRALLGIFFSFILIQEIFSAKKTQPWRLDRASDGLSDLLWFGLRPDRSAAKNRKGDPES